MRASHEGGLGYLGKTLNINTTPLGRGFLSRIPMSYLIAQLTQFFAPSSAPIPVSPAAALMESADLCAGFDARHAQELRFAASAWLRVVR